MTNDDKSAGAAYLDARMRGLCDEGAEEVARDASGKAARDEEVTANDRQPDSGIPFDTTPGAARLRIEALAALSGADRLREALELSDAVRALSEAGRRRRAAEPPSAPVSDGLVS